MKNVFLVCFCAALIAACGEDGGDAGTNDQMSGGEGAPVMMGGETDDSSVMMGGEVDGGMAMMGGDAGETAPVMMGGETDDSSVMMGGEVDGGMAMMGDDAGETAPILTGDEPGWNATCAENTDCEAPVSLCSKQPGQAEGYCSTPCTTTADCPYEDWTCNVIGGCESPLATWCGPRRSRRLCARRICLRLNSLNDRAVTSKRAHPHSAVPIS